MITNQSLIRPSVLFCLGLGLGLLAGCSDDSAAGAGGGSGGGGGGDGGGDPWPQCFEPSVEVAACDPATATFSLASTNPYYPLVVGNSVVLEGMEDGVLIRVERTVLPDTETVAGVETHVLEAIEYLDDEIYEVARNFYVEASDGTVCYFGEDVDFYENGRVVNNDGSWRAGVDGAKPGIIMPASPAAGDGYYQENAPGIALDMGRVDAVGLSETFGTMSYDDVIRVMDSNPIDDEDACSEEEKLYVVGIGEAADTVKRMIAFTPGG